MGGEFLAFVSEMAQVVATHVHPTPEPPAVVPAVVPEVVTEAKPAVPGVVPVAMAARSTAPTDGFFLDEEKVTWDWPDIGGRVIEDSR